MVTPYASSFYMIDEALNSLEQTPPHTTFVENIPPSDDDIKDWPPIDFGD